MGYKIDFLYKSMHHEKYTIGVHTHNCYELVYYLVGDGKVETAEDAYYYNNGDIIIVAPNTRHNEIGQRKGENIVLGFHAADNETFIPTGKYRANLNISRILEHMSQEMSKQFPFFQEIAELQLNEVLYLLQRSRITEGEVDFSKILKNVESYIEEYLALPICINDFATMYHYSQSRFRHLFKERVGISPKQFILKKRLERAERLLLETDKSLTEIAMDCGFYDSAQFGKFFKKAKNCTPSSFRNNMMYQDNKF